MIKKTFRTLKANPVILLGFALLLIIVYAAYFSIINLGLSMTSDLIAAEQAGVTLSDERMASFYFGLFEMLGVFALIGLAVGFLGVPPVFQKVYEACSGINTPGWIGRGLRRSWWKVVVTALAALVGIAGLMLVIFFVLQNSFSGFLVLPVLEVTAAVFTIIAVTAVIAEDNYRVALNRTFKIGSKYFFRLLGVGAAAMVPLIMIFSGLSVYLLYSLNLAPGIMNMGMSAEGASYSIEVVWGAMIAMGIYSVFAGAFVYTYSMHNYLRQRDAVAET